MRLPLLGGYGAVGYETTKNLLKRIDCDAVIPLWKVIE